MEVTTAKKIDVKRLATSNQTVGKLQKSLQTKAKNEPSYRFYSLWDKIFRDDVLYEAYKRCRKNCGIAGVDGVTFKDIEEEIASWLGRLKEELEQDTYQPQPLLRVWIPKSNGKLRPLSIPTIRDRVVQMAMHMVIGSIFDVDLDMYQYGFRPGLDAKMAVRRVYYQVAESNRTEIIDGDLSDYFSTIPHGPLMKSIARRISDGKVLATIRSWLQAPVMEKVNDQYKRTTQAKNTNRGAAQGGPISPLLSNIYFRRLMMAWKQYGFYKKGSFNAHIINYADDFVVCCEKGKGEAALKAIRTILGKLGLTLNKEKTCLVDIKKESIDFLGYTLGMMYGKDGRCYFGTQPSKKAVKSILKKIHDATTTQWNYSSAEDRVMQLNRMLRGWYNYFDQGPVTKTYRIVTQYTERRLRRWLMRKHKRRGTGYRQYPDKYLYETLELYKPPMSRADRSSAKVC